MKKINNEINEDFVSFEIAKLLKEKGFAIGQTSGYWANGFLSFNGVYEYGRPTHALTIKWIYTNFNYWVCVFETEAKWNYNIFNKNQDCVMSTGMFLFPEEAIEAALLYTLQNLIP